MIKQILSCLLLLIVLSGSAQEVVSTQGDSYSNANGSIDFTIGEVITATGSNGGNNITQGFHQTNLNVLGVDDHFPSYEAIIFPNPTEDILNIRTSTFEDVTYTLYDVQGKLLMQNKLFAEQTPIQLVHLAAGGYSLVLTNETQKLKTFRIVKTH